MAEHDEEDEDRAPICPNCGVTALPSEVEVGFVCENPDCPAYGDEVGLTDDRYGRGVHGESWTIRETLLTLIGVPAMVGAIVFLVAGLLTPRGPDNCPVTPVP